MLCGFARQQCFHLPTTPINLKFNQLEKGQYITALYNLNGQQVINQTIDHTGGVLNKIIYIDKKLPAGIYYLQVTGTNFKAVQRIFIKP